MEMRGEGGQRRNLIRGPAEASQICKTQHFGTQDCHVLANDGNDWEVLE